MFWRARSTRAADFPPDGEGTLRPIPAISGAGLGGGGFGKSPHVAYGQTPFADRTGGAGRDPGAKDPQKGAAGPETGDKADLESAKAGPESKQKTQPSGADGVEEDMATLVLDNTALGAGTASRPDSRPENVAGGLDPTGDAAVMLRVAAGDEASFNYLVQKYHRAMIHFLFRMVRNQAVAEELAQEVFLRVYRSRESYRAEAKFTTWLYRIATNLAVNNARDTRHERAAQTLYLDAPDEETGTTPDVADDEPSVEQHLMHDERMAAIRKHVMALPERQKMAVLMHKYQGMDYRQIGDVLKLSESATKSLLFRAYQTLRDKLKEFV
ncbi:MAG: sigma-70 family RNA polymerase sigma factor [Terracidiphilus sp.]